MSRIQQKLAITFVLLIGVILLVKSQTYRYDINNMASDSSGSASSNKEKSNEGSNEGSHENAVKDSNSKGAEQPIESCTVFNPLSHTFVDLRGLSSMENEGKPLPWSARGYDKKLNFTLGICSTAFRKNHDKGGEIRDSVNSSSIGGYYIDPASGKYVSIGEYSTTPVVRGKKISLSYANGSYCDNVQNSKTGEKLRKSTTLLFTCDRDMLSRGTISFVDSIDDCHYIFEVKSPHACPTAAKSDDLAVIWIFLLILVAALTVFFLGGSVYRLFTRKPQITSVSF
ncbi:Piso0_002214 [Millerozyma farinosa CBS 7064]|uniref:Piso0_002214 protein n=1 Tax=Pichia sorbitophila (strain ATCC MYA-4447 / BCRC 22081 / CBS 7064 / NBRC 10061 / NRRL Y-12695) TaxID=559304 RepID=G8YC06_PICSO|nr:Piso0_002214 [Millerozyma farinosa CBS 7064]